MSQSHSVHRSSRMPWLALWVVSTAVILGLCARPKSAPVVEDEIYWIGSSYYYNLAFVQRDWGNPDWRLLPARENPPIAKYVVGASLALTGEHITSPDLLACFYVMFSKIPGAWGTGADYEQRAAVARRLDPALRQQVETARHVTLTPALLVPPRIAMVVCIALTSLLVFLFAQTVVGKPVALLASQALLLHPIATEAYNHALADAVAMLLSAGAAIAILGCTATLMQADRNWGAMARNAALAGFLLGLACGAKMNSLVILALAGVSLAFVLAGAVSPLDRSRITGAAAMAAGALALAVTTFVVINPAIYDDVGAGLAATITEHRRTEVIQRSFLNGGLESLSAKVTAVGDMLAFSPLLVFPLAFLAIAALASPRPGVRLVGAWWLVAWLGVTLWIPFQRLRYVAPLLVPTLLLAAIGADLLVVWLRSAGRRRFVATRTRAS